MRLPLALGMLLASTSLAAAEVRVMASIKPLHALVAEVMAGVGTPGLIVDGSNSPHTYALKPSNAAELQQAEVIFWVGHELEAFLEKPLQSLGSKAKQVALLEAPGLATLPVREGNGFDMDDHGHAESGEKDPHIWLDPHNAKTMVTQIAVTLAQVDAANAATYISNAEAVATRLDALELELNTTLAPAKGKGFIVFHDAYQYFETRFGVKATGAIAIHPENPPGAEAIAALRQRLTDGNIKCVFAEPQFDNRLVTVILEGFTAQSATLDPLGATLAPGPDLYETMMRNLAKAFADCLS